MKILINENSRASALTIHKEYINFMKVNFVFILFAFILFLMGNLSEYLMFNNSDILSISQNTSQTASGKPIMPSLSFFSWITLLFYLVSYFFIPSLILWFNQNNNLLRDKKTRKANKINFGYLKTLLKSLINYRIYLLVLLLSFIALFGLMMILRTIPEITNGLELVFKEIMLATNKGVAFDVSNSEAYKNYMTGIDNISILSWIIAGLETLLTIIFVHCMYFVSLPLLLLNKDIGVFKSIYLGIKSIVINWHVYFSVFFVSLILIVLTKSIESVFVLSKMLSVLLPTLLLPYFIILNKYLFKKA